MRFIRNLPVAEFSQILLKSEWDKEKTEMKNERDT